MPWDEPARRPRRPRGDTLLRVTVELSWTVAALIALFLVHEIWVSSWLAAASQQVASQELDEHWAAASAPGVAAEPPSAEFVPGAPVARLRIPAFGDEWTRVVVEGVTQADLARGPGHYPGTAGPGEPGNLAIAGHRVGRGAPFDALGDLQPCDTLLVDTARTEYTYRLLPFPDAEPVSSEACAEVTRLLTGPGETAALYRSIPGRRIVAPDERSVIDPVPGLPTAVVPPDLHLLTVTTCHPRFSARQRLVVHAVLVGARPRGEQER